MVRLRRKVRCEGCWVILVTMLSSLWIGVQSPGRKNNLLYFCKIKSGLRVGAQPPGLKKLLVIVNGI